MKLLVLAIVRLVGMVGTYRNLVCMSLELDRGERHAQRRDG